MTDSEEPKARPFAALPNPETADDPEERRRERRSLFELPQGAFGFFLLLLLAAASGGLIVVYWPWLTGSDPGSQSDRVAALETRVDQMAAGQAHAAAAGAFSDMRRDLKSLGSRLDADEARLSAVEKGGGQTGDAGSTALKSSLDQDAADLNALAARVAKLEQQSGNSAQYPARLDADDKAIAELRAGMDSNTRSLNDALGSLGARVDTLEHNAPPPGLAARVVKLESNDPVGMIHRAAAVLALAELVRATAGSAPFASELSTLRSFVPDAPELSDLSRYAKAGAPTHAMLAEQFPAVAASALSAERNASASGWIGKLWANVAGAVSVRRIGEVNGDDTEAHLARAGGRLDAGDLAGALSEMNGLDKPARAAASSWIAQARERLAVDRDTRNLADRLVRNLPPKPAAGKAG